MRNQGLNRMSEKRKELRYNFMRKEIQDKILNAAAKADKEMRDLNLDKLSAQIQFDYGIGHLTVDRIVQNLLTLGLIEQQGNIIHIPLKKVPQNGSNEPQD